VNPQTGELWEFTQAKRIRAGSNIIVTFLISGPALVIECVPSRNVCDACYRILRGGELVTYSTLEVNRSFGEKCDSAGH
jgi:hypothetical protein